MATSRVSLLVLTAMLAAGPAVGGSAGPLTVDEVMAAGHPPIVRVVDTESSLGPLAVHPQTVTLEDLVRYHGHPCDGLVVAAAGMAYGLHALFPNGVVDRTDVEVVVNGSACYGDVAAYLTGARHRFGSLVVDPKLGDEWILHRVSTGATVRVRLRSGIKPKELPKLESQLRAADCPEDLIKRVQAVQRAYALDVLLRPADQVFVIDTVKGFNDPGAVPRPDAAKARCTAATTPSDQ